MAKPRTPNQKDRYSELNGRLNKYVALVEQIYETLNGEAAKAVTRTDYSTDTGKPFKWADYPQTKKSINDLQDRFVEELHAVIHRGTSEEWKNSNEVQDLLANRVLKAYDAEIDSKKRKVLYQTNSDALKAFQERKEKGMNLSAKLWNQSEDYKNELEAAISCAVQKGTSAVTLSKQVSKYLQDFPSLQKDYTERYGKASGVQDCEYRSIRLARSEINMAYRKAENERWKQMDFVVGFEIKPSTSHDARMPDGDVCDTLAGKYPKDFEWTGWHPNCMCYKISILKTEEEFWDDTNRESVNQVNGVPENFEQWVRDNRDRIEAAKARGTLPYFIRDNEKVVEDILKKQSPLEIAAARHAARTPEDVQAIKDAWAESRETSRSLDAMEDLFPDVRKYYGKYSIDDLEKSYDRTEWELRRLRSRSGDLRTEDERLARLLDEDIDYVVEGYKAPELMIDAFEKELKTLDEMVGLSNELDNASWWLKEHPESKIQSSLLDEARKSIDKRESLTDIRKKTSSVINRYDEELNKYLSDREKEYDAFLKNADFSDDNHIKEQVAKVFDMVNEKIDKKDIEIEEGYVKLTAEQMLQLNKTQFIRKTDEDNIYGHYVQSRDYRFLNRIQRGLEKSSRFPVSYVDSRPIIESLDFATSNNKTLFPVRVVRRVDGNAIESMAGFSTASKQDIFALQKNLQSKGNVSLTDKAVMSFSFDAEANYFKSRPVELVIDIPAGKNMYITNNEQESEGILGRNTVLHPTRSEIVKLPDEDGKLIDVLRVFCTTK